MRIDPILSSLRRDAGPQRRAQRVLEAVRAEWKADRGVSEVLAQFVDYGAGRPLADCPTLAAVACDCGRASAFLAPLINGLVAELSRHPIGHVPFRHQYASGISVLLLGESGRATLSLVTYQNELLSGRSPAQSVCFTGGERYECYLAGSAEACIVEACGETDQGARLVERQLGLDAGETLALDGARVTKLVTRVPQRLVMLRLSRVPERPPPAREYRLADGRLIHRASGSRRESREEMMIALLGRMGRTDAGEVFANLAGSAGSEHLRWEALRQCLSLGTAEGFAALSRLAADRDNVLAAPAAALRSRLASIHPELACLETGPCRA
ncbi:hypothetical protein [Qipengyuania spongiae]|uniref:HEAT repeat domain-containing protein n=1 Tax=Qipengyuania spongiae TaxID=2909673 RepID=A0ABY5SVC3_9SPHN|nr:hypothetical protein [Qipengyuania spongiae]UVI38452.1 hypothetical protein L1F33_09285 [Qipengyuania spongiae]